MSTSNHIENGQDLYKKPEVEQPLYLETVKYHWAHAQAIFSRILKDFAGIDHFISFVRGLKAEDVHGLQEKLQKKLVEEPNNREALLVFALTVNLLAVAEETQVIKDLLPRATSSESDMNQKSFPVKFLRALIGIDFVVSSFNVNTNLKSPFKNIKISQ